jgi:hypothetical protein
MADSVGESALCATNVTDVKSRRATIRLIEPPREFYYAGPQEAGARRGVRFQRAALPGRVAEGGQIHSA